MQVYSKAALEEKSKVLLANSMEADNKPVLTDIRTRKTARGAGVASTQYQHKEAEGMKKWVFRNDNHRWCLKEETA